MRFVDRVDAGKKLAQKLFEYKNNSGVVVFGLARGGIVCAKEVARELNALLDIIIVRKIGLPHQPELAAGAMTQEGELLFNRDVMSVSGVTEDDLQSVIEKEKQELQRRIDVYLQGRNPISLQGKTAILVDDGIATGITMQAAIATVVARGAQTVVVAVPVAPESEIKKLRLYIDHVVCLFEPVSFFGIGQFYDNFAQVNDDEVVKLLRI